MRTVVAGIDLGTTNSVIAIPGQFPDQGLVFGDVTVIWDDVERLTHASAVCEAAGERCVGNDAKQLAAEGHTPVRFVKKYMGTDKKSRVGDVELLPEEVSALILRHLCAFAEQALDVKITGAVITHPAYFDGLAIDATKKAGELAGLKVEGLLMEPVAAAMAFCGDDARATMNVLVYDLGGGTFDVTLVSRSGSAFVPLKFGGNRELGGYNFDKKIALKMLDSLREKGYRLQFDPSAPERDPRWATLMHHAEKVKIDLSPKGASKASVRIPTVFKDDAGKGVQLNFAMAQSEFLELIEPEIAETIRETGRVLEKAKLKPDLLVLVGGSCRIHAIQQRLEQEFGIPPEITENFDDVLDLSVAVGAAMVAAAAGTCENGVTLGPVPQTTNESSVIFSGLVEATAHCPDVTGLVVSISGGASGDQRTLTNQAGKFFLETELSAHNLNRLHFQICDRSEQVLFQRDFEVSHGAGPTEGPKERPKAMLPKALAVSTELGFYVLAEEGVTLPINVKESFETTEELEVIEIDLFQEDIQLSTIRLSGFGKPVPASCRLDIEIEIGADYAMQATVVVPAASIRKTQEVKLKPMAVPTLPELKADFAQVRQTFGSQIQNTPDGEQKAKIGLEGEILIEEIEGHLKSEMPELLQTCMLVKRLLLLAKQLGNVGGLSPSKAVMDEKFEKACELLPQALSKKPAMREQNYDKTLAALRAEADRAYQQDDTRTWSQIARKLDGMIQDLERALQGDGPGLDAIPAFAILRDFRQCISEIRSLVAERLQAKQLTDDLARRCSDELDAAEKKLGAVDLSNEEAAKHAMLHTVWPHISKAETMAGVSGASKPPIRKI